MFKKSKWTAPILKSDLRNVLIYGFVLMLLGGILAGAVNYLFFFTWHLNVTIGVFIIMVIVGLKLRTVYDSFHILYPILGIVFVYFAFIIANLTEFLIYFNGDFRYAVDFCLSQYQFYLLPIINASFYDFLVVRDFNLLQYLMADIKNFMYFSIATISTIIAYIGTYKIIKGKNL